MFRGFDNISSFPIFWSILLNVRPHFSWGAIWILEIISLSSVHTSKIFLSTFPWQRKILPVWTSKFSQIRLVQPAWPKAGLHSFSTSDLLALQWKLARVDGQQGKLATNLRAHPIFTSVLFSFCAQVHTNLSKSVTGARRQHVSARKN